ncbi:nucleotide pyrophosphohydrolase [Vibrio sp. V1B]|uniref:MazG nucleotide pyrophosphohydrolase domain-containing protein n=1 Tax=Vibrio harveyi group TaxID=717610 RepID=UPI00039E7A23|nr:MULTISPECIES: MazG nucleotide pyrophosphohydrolase domain-containing protein [Vibrio harveyi group]PAW07655.1 nucleotide pyrophosphohydrolase [Vibrio sp. V1B]
MDKFTALFEIAQRKSNYDENNTWYQGSVTYFEGIYSELEEVRDEEVKGRTCFLEDELGDVLWNYLNLLMALEKEQGIDARSVIERAVEKYQARVTAIENGKSWAEVKAEQKSKLKNEFDSKRGNNNETD